MARSTTAQAAYSARFAGVASLLEKLDAGLVAHSDRQAADARNWGYAGDLGHVEELLGRALFALTGEGEEPA
jgi:hypothetical protein